MDPVMKAIVEKLSDEEKERYEVNVRGRWRPLIGLPRGAIPTEIRLSSATVRENPGRHGRQQLGKVAIVQLERLGDILSILPLAYRLWQEGNTIDWYCKPEFAWVLKHCSYVTICVVETGLAETRRGLTLQNTALAPFGDVYDRIICPQVDQNPVPPPGGDRGRNFICQQWMRGGRPEGLEEGWPLVFDKADVVRWHGLSKTPVMLVNLKGHSSRLEAEQSRQLMAWIVRTFEGQFLVEEWPENRPLPVLLSMLAAVNLTGGCLVSIDSAPIHLAAATSTPTIVLTRGGWDCSERQAHWIGPAIRYDDLFLGWENGPTLGQSQFGRKLAHFATDSRVFHVVDWWLPPKLGEEYDRIVDARKTWCVAGRSPSGLTWEVVPFCGLGRRSAADLPPSDNSGSGTEKREKPVPYIKDIIDFGVQQARLRSGSEQSWVVFTNSDIHLCADAEQILLQAREKSPTGGCFFSRRKDFRNLEDIRTPYRSSDRPFRSIRDHVGADLFAVQVWWWEAHRDEVPDMLVAFEGWDYCMRHLFWKYNKDAQLPTCIYHQIHEANWSKPENLLTSPGQVYNRKVGGDWARAMGLPVSDSGVQLFDPDPET